jgi:hypothetical protein
VESTPSIGLDGTMGGNMETPEFVRAVQARLLNDVIPVIFIKNLA